MARDVDLAGDLRDGRLFAMAMGLIAGHHRHCRAPQGQARQHDMQEVVSYPLSARSWIVTRNERKEYTPRSLCRCGEGGFFYFCQNSEPARPSRMTAKIFLKLAVETWSMRRAPICAPNTPPAPRSRPAR